LGVDPIATKVEGRVRGISYGPPNGVVGDLDQDCSVDLDDYTAFLAGYGAPLTGLLPSARHALGDVNLDGQHTVQDFLEFRSQFEKGGAPGALAEAVARGQFVPEPLTRVTALLAVTAMVIHWPVREPRHAR
jgi:hypothetical protein